MKGLFYYTVWTNKRVFQVRIHSIDKLKSIIHWFFVYVYSELFFLSSSGLLSLPHLKEQGLSISLKWNFWMN